MVLFSKGKFTDTVIKKNVISVVKNIVIQNRALLQSRKQFKDLRVARESVFTVYSTGMRELT